MYSHWRPKDATNVLVENLEWLGRRTFCCTLVDWWPSVYRRTHSLPLHSAVVHRPGYQSSALVVIQLKSGKVVARDGLTMCPHPDLLDLERGSTCPDSFKVPPPSKRIFSLRSQKGNLTLEKNKEPILRKKILWDVTLHVIHKILYALVVQECRVWIYVIVPPRFCWIPYFSLYSRAGRCNSDELTICSS